METYPLAPETIRRQLKRVFWQFQLVVTLSFLAFGLYIASLGRPIQPLAAVGVVALVAAVYFVIIFYHYRQQLRILYSIRIELERDRITRRQAWQPPQTIMRADVTQVQEQKDGLLICTVSPRISMLVPFGLARDGDREVRRLLASWSLFETLPRQLRRVSFLTFWFAVVSGLLILIFANSLLVAVPLGVFLLFYGTYAEGRLMRTYDVEWRITRSYSLAFAFLIFIITMKSCVLWFISLQ